MDKRPPPYFPQSSLSPNDENRYRKFKLIVGALIAGGGLIVLFLLFLAYRAIAWYFSG
ncbi:MAG: hypothetical protein HKN25_01810 [Pyrinomonadaceae bacterium]|nr:hypothetical protein [Pyrinomonadaceae bacterium]